ncbi:50S ribosomal protein L4 [Patescibacteria group bacterium]|nr:50S ribosomal protein L4 [Patescibacteria group bacterium]
MPKVKKETTKKATRLTAPVYSLAGRQTGTINLPKEFFGQKVNKSLLTQAVRVYSTNRKTLPGSTKTRGEVKGSTAKIYSQKGTGRARHGSIRAPIFVGGGIVFGPKVRKVRLDLPKRMKKAALVSALSSKMEDKNVIGLTGAEKATGKTKEMVGFTEKLKLATVLIVTGEKSDNIVRASRNIPGLTILSANQLNAYEVLRHKSLVISKESLEKLK